MKFEYDIKIGNIALMTLGQLHDELCHGGEGLDDEQSEGDYEKINAIKIIEQDNLTNEELIKVQAIADELATLYNRIHELDCQFHDIADCR